LPTVRNLTRPGIRDPATPLHCEDHVFHMMDSADSRTLTMGKQPQAEVVYTNRYNLDMSFKKAYIDMFEDIYRFRALIWQYIRRDFVASYRGTFLGFIWKLILPLVPISVYIFLQLLGIFTTATGMNKALYVACGMTFWSLWAESLSVTLDCLSRQSSMIKKMKVPLIIVYITSIGQILFDTLTRMALVIALLIIYGQTFHWTWIALPVIALPCLVFGFALGVLLSFFAVFTKDVKNVVSIIIRYGLFASAVIFALPMDNPIVERVALCNPMFHLVDGTRNLLVTGTLTYPVYWTFCSIVGVALCLLALKKASSMEERLVWAL
jgi:ABC-type polysaccharide/polyol phosphate export permease